LNNLFKIKEELFQSNDHNTENLREACRTARRCIHSKLNNLHILEQMFSLKLKKHKKMRKDNEKVSFRGENNLKMLKTRRSGSRKSDILKRLTLAENDQLFARLTLVQKNIFNKA